MQRPTTGYDDRIRRPATWLAGRLLCLLVHHVRLSGWRIGLRRTGRSVLWNLCADKRRKKNRAMRVFLILRCSLALAALGAVGLTEAQVESRVAPSVSTPEAGSTADVESCHRLKYAPPPPDNPLMGLVPYAGSAADLAGDSNQGQLPFPHSMEFGYFPLSELIPQPGQYDWSRLDSFLTSVAGRGHQAVFRIFVEYPGREEGIPGFLLEDGLKVHRYRVGGKKVITPDYHDARLRRLLVAFVKELGKRHDKDPRIAYVTAGLLGHWGEWHTSPHPEWFADKALQDQIMDAYQASFPTTPILLRYPAGDGHATIASNRKRPFGYHDDSFAWSTIATGKPGDQWFFVPALVRAQTTERWKTHPVGGEIRPEAWGQVFDDHPADARVQDFCACVHQTHATWMMDSGMFRNQIPPARRARAIDWVAKMGYALHVPWVRVQAEKGGRMRFAIAIENRGVAPFYRNWPVHIGLISEDGTIARQAVIDGRIDGLLPDDPARIWNATLDVSGLPPAVYTAGLRVPNPMPGGHPVRFANAEQDADAEQWLSLQRVEISQ